MALLFMSTKSFQARSPRIPLPVEGIQVNGCRNPTCESFLVLAPIQKVDGEVEVLPDAYKRGDGSYQISGTGKGTVLKVCSREGARPWQQEVQATLPFY